MTFHLSSASLKAAIKHLSRYGDTDVFPHLPELAFFNEDSNAVIAELSKLDLDNYRQDFVALAPLAFEAAHKRHRRPAIFLFREVRASALSGASMDRNSTKGRGFMPHVDALGIPTIT